jgi:hypothetical protein
MPSAANLKFRTAVGAVMVLLGAFVLMRIYLAGQPPKLGRQSIDTIFGIFFILRGALSLRSSRRLASFTANRQAADAAGE